jgi:hypothetical protein
VIARPNGQRPVIKHTVWANHALTKIMHEGSAERAYR